MNALSLREHDLNSNLKLCLSLTPFFFFPFLRFFWRSHFKIVERLWQLRFASGVSTHLES